jgi:trimeric autotransporter adhesin
MKYLTPVKWQLATTTLALVALTTLGKTAFAQLAPNNVNNRQVCAIGEATNTGVQVNTRGTSSTRSLACGVATQATGGESTAVGPAATATAEKSTALGTDSIASAINSVAVGYGSVADRTNTVSVGTASAPRQIVNIANGTQANDAVNLSQLDAVSVSAADAVALANTADQNASQALAFGNAAFARAFRGVTYVADADGRNSNVIDLSASSFVGGLVTITNLAAGINPTDAVNRGQLDAVIARNNLQGIDIDSVQIGNGCQAIDGKSVCVGFGNKASGNGAVAIGDPNIAEGTGAVAIGADNTATSDGAVAIGNQSLADQVGNVAIGNAAQATGVNSVAIGNGAIAGQANTVSFGAVGSERKLVNVAAGTAPTDAVNVSQLDAVSAATAAIQVVNTTQNARLTALETLGVGAIPALQEMTQLHSAQISELFAMTDKDRRDARRGSAAAMAMTTAPMPSNVGGVSYAANVATYRGEQAIGFSFAYRANTDNPFALTGGFTHAGRESIGLRVGMAGEF